MPRVNRDIQRRMAARRERERRRDPSTRRYEFASPARSDQTDADLAPTTEQVNGATQQTPAAPRPTARARAATGRPAARAFSEYRAEYAYVVGDLRRVAIVIGSLLVALVALSFVLPR